MRLIILSLLLVALPTQVSAQRTQSGQSSWILSVSYNGTSAGVETFYQQYTIAGFWEAGLMCNDYSTPLSTGQSLRYDQLGALAGYHYRIAATRSRTFNWYAGGGLYAGIEYLDPFNNIPPYVSLGRNCIQFLYGLYARSGVEWFMGRKVALTVNCIVEVNFSSMIKHFHWRTEAGLKILLN